MAGGPGSTRTILCDGECRSVYDRSRLSERRRGIRRVDDGGHREVSSQMREAVIVSVARTPIGRAYKGAFNNTSGAELGGHAIAAAAKRAGVAREEIEDVVMGCALQQGSTGTNVAR